jgi:hypothetical protein
LNLMTKKHINRSTMTPVKGRRVLIGIFLPLIILFLYQTEAVAQLESAEEYEFVMKLRDLAIENYAGMRWHDMEAAHQNARMRTARMDFFDAFTFSYNFWGFDPNQNIPVIAGLGLSVNLGRFFSTRPRVREAYYLRERAKADKERDKMRIAMELIDLYASYKHALEYTKLTTEAFENSRQTLHFFKTQFEAGEISLLELQLRADGYTENGKIYIDAKSDLIRAKLLIEEFIGRRLEEVE